MSNKIEVWRVLSELYNFSTYPNININSRPRSLLRSQAGAKAKAGSHTLSFTSTVSFEARWGSSFFNVHPSEICNPQAYSTYIGHTNVQHLLSLECYIFLFICQTRLDILCMRIQFILKHSRDFYLLRICLLNDIFFQRKPQQNLFVMQLNKVETIFCLE